MKKFIKLVKLSGKRYFTLDQILKATVANRKSILSALSRLKKQGELISPAKGLYIIVPPEDQNMGCIPAEELVPILMKYWELDYYTCLLTAAFYHGASHQKSQVFQVITNKQIKKQLSFGKIKIEFIFKRELTDLMIQSITVKTGYLKISSPELTMMDLLVYPDRSGGLNHIATVLSELIEKVELERLMDLAKKSIEKTWIQRLGYILSKIETMEEERKEKIIMNLRNYLKSQKLVYIPLASELTVKNIPRSKEWKIIENTIIESDL